MFESKDSHGYLAVPSDKGDKKRNGERVDYSDGTEHVGKYAQDFVSLGTVGDEVEHEHDSIERDRAKHLKIR